MTTAAGFSLKRQLLLWLLLPQLILWLMGGVLAFRVAMTYAEKAIDQSLTQSVRSLARQVKPFGSGLLVDFPKAAQDILEQDPKDRVSYMPPTIATAPLTISSEKENETTLRNCCGLLLVNAGVPY